MIELCGDHRAPGYPDVARLLAVTLGATRQHHPDFSAETMIATDRYFSYWSYRHGVDEIDDDIEACCIVVPDASATVMADLIDALAKTGQFVREELRKD